MRTSTAPAGDVDRICRIEHHDPFSVLGCQPVAVEGRAAVAVRALLPHAKRAYVLRERHPRRRRLWPVDGRGLFEAVFRDRRRVFPYRLEVHNHDGSCYEWEDPYRFPPVLGDFDLQLLGEGNHLESWRALGAHVIEHCGLRGTHFAVWAPSARRVSVVGDFNGWDGRVHAMRSLGGSGVWEIFLPGIGPGETYKYEVLGADGSIVAKADPRALFAEQRPKSASKVWDIDRYEWGDAEWLQRRAAVDPLTAPMSVYEVHLGSWRLNAGEGYRWLTYRELAEELTAYVVEMGYTHVELLPVSEHPHDGSWGYQCLGYFAPTSRFGTPDDFMFLVDSLHRAGIGVILDWVPAHFPRDEHGLARFDGAALYEHADPQLGEHPDWGTLIFDYGRAEVRNFLISSALFWLEVFHLDGLRVDAVASLLYLDYSREDGEWSPNELGGRENLRAIEFLKRLNEVCHVRNPGAVVIAEESTAFPGVSRPVHDGGLGFTFKWNMGWMHDTLDYIQRDPVHRRYHHEQLTFGMMYAYSENFVLPISHDEVVHMKGSLLGKMPGDDWQKRANLRLYLGLQWTMPGKPLLFMGQELGQPTEWSEGESLPWHLLDDPGHAGAQRYAAALNRVYRDQPSLWQRDHAPEGFQWLQADDADGGTLAFVRRAADPADHVVVACNLTPVVRHDYVVGVPEGAPYREVLCSDGGDWGGSGITSPDPYPPQPHGAMGQPASLHLTLPPLAIVILAPVR